MLASSVPSPLRRRWSREPGRRPTSQKEAAKRRDERGEELDARVHGRSMVAARVKQRLKKTEQKRRGDLMREIDEKHTAARARREAGIERRRLQAKADA